MKSSFSLYKKAISAFVISLVLLSSQVYAQNTPALISFPAGGTETVTACNGPSIVTVQIDFTSDAVGSSEATIDLQLGQQMEYVSGSVLKVSGAAGLSIAEDGGTINAPRFKVSGTIATSDRITFTIEQVGDCDAKVASENNTVFESVATVTVNGVSTSPKTSPSFVVDFPELTFTQPLPQNNAVLNTQYTRTFEITNGAEGCANAIHFSIERDNGSTSLVSLTLAGNTITPTSIVGNIEYYTVSGANLTADEQLCNGETLIFTETYKFNSCTSSTVTNYSTGWGCDADPANWCETSSGIGTIATALGVGEFKNGDLTNQKIGYVDMCTLFTVRSTYKNSGNGNPSAGGLYDVNILRGSYSSGNSLRGFPGFVNISDVTINGLPVPFSFSATNQLEINIEDHFTTDPDGAGVGLEDLDGDGFYDDLPVGAILQTDFTWTFNCSFSNACGDAADDLSMYKVGAIMKYHEKCDQTIISTDVVSTTGVLGYTYSQLNANGNAPANIVGGTPFRIRLSAAYFNIHNDFHTSNSRYTYEIVLPPGLNVAGSGNPTWTTGQFGGTVSVLATPPTVSQNGNVVTITSPTSAFGFVNIDLEYTCGNGGTVNIPYTLNQINSSSCDCLQELVCGSLTVNADCPGVCPGGGPSVSIPVVRRADNSLGWTDRNMNTRQLAANINAYDLSKALYLDTIEIHSKVRQNGPSQNFYVRLELPTTNLSPTNQKKLEPLSVDVVIKRGGNDIVTANVTNSSQTESTASNQKIDFNLTSILPSGGLLDGDSLILVANYRVRVNTGLPLYDVQSGGSWYAYNKGSNGAKIYCNNFTPEMYLVGTVKLNGTNPFVVNACDAIPLGYSTSYLARRFNTSGLKYSDEFRPALYITSMEVTMPPGYDYVNSKFRLVGSSYGGVNPPDITITPTSIVGNVYTFDNPGVGVTDEWKALEISVTNTYGAYIPFTVKGSCLTEEDEPITIRVKAIDYYYHTKGLSPSSNNFNTELNILDRNIELRNKADVSIQDQTGTIQSTSLTESFVVRMQSTGLSTAPYNWFAIDDVPGVSITQIVELPSGNVIPSAAYTGGDIYYLSLTGLASGASKDYRIDFTYTTCSPTNITVQGGWNCDSYPTDPSSYPCGASTVNLTFIPQLGGVEIIPITETVSNVSLCDPIPFEYRINSTRAGNVLENTYTVVATAGIAPEFGSFEVEFPVGSGIWESISETINGANHTIDLSTHSNYPTDGINGTLSDQGNPNSRLIGVRYNMITNCNFIAGSGFSMFTNAISLCGNPTSGSGRNVSTPGIAVDGVTADYIVDVNIKRTSGSFDNCGGPITLTGFYQITSTGPTTGSNAYLLIKLPQGYNYTSNSYTATGSNQAIYNGVTASPNDEVIRLDVPSGLSSGSTLNYTIDITESTTSYVICGNKFIEVSAIDDIANVACASETGGFCPAISIEVANFKLNYSVDKASATLTATSTLSTMNGNNEDIEAHFDVTNNHSSFDIAAGTLIEVFHDANQNGVLDAGDALLTTHNTTSIIPAGGTVSDFVSFTASPNQVCNILLVISRNKNTCLCNGSVVDMIRPSLVEGIAGVDQPACEVNDSQNIGNANNPGYTYSWEGTTAAETGYLDDPTISNPTFNYGGPAISSPTTITYTLTITRPGGCKSKDEVVVDLEPSLGTSITIATPGYTTMPCEDDDVTMVAPVFSGGNYQWFKDNVENHTITNNHYNIPSLQQTDAGYYTAVITVGRCKVAGGILLDPSLCGGALAVDLTLFNSKCDPNGNVIISWVTASETNSLDFILQKSKDLKSWETVDLLKAQGNSSTSNSYTTIDRYPYSGIAYYQLIQRDIDGKETLYSPLSESCERNDETELKVYPNPTNGDFKVEFYSGKDAIYNLQLIDVNGRVFSSKTHLLEKGTNTLMISEHLVKGFYIIKLTSDSNEVRSAKLIVN